MKQKNKLTVSSLLNVGLSNIWTLVSIYLQRHDTKLSKMHLSHGTKLENGLGTVEWVIVVADWVTDSVTSIKCWAIRNHLAGIYDVTTSWEIQRCFKSSLMNPWNLLIETFVILFLYFALAAFSQRIWLENTTFMEFQNGQVNNNT